MPAWVRWILAAVGAAAVTGALFLAMPSMIRIGDPEPGRALIAWQEANPPEYGGIPIEIPILDGDRAHHRLGPVDEFPSFWDQGSFADFRLAYQRKLAFRYRYRDPIPLTELNIHHLP